MSKSIWYRLVLSQVTLFLLLTETVHPCGTGRGGFRRRGNRKTTPLVFRQYIPNVSENTLGASGMTEGAIKRGTERFSELVENTNPDIIFKDEEGTGADKLMTQRCKDKLNTLAISVENTWPNVKLRVTEGWDEENHHAKDSLHYEGRAVDVTTSDRDRSKYGQLARLAVEAGFDYVFYESRGHIHCSVKSDNALTTNYGGCYSANETVTLEDGSTKSMTDLEIGDHVLTLTPEGQPHYSPILLFFHQNPDTPAEFLKITTESDQSITLTPNHLIYFSSKNNTNPKDLTAAFAMEARKGDFVYLKDIHGDFVFQRVKSIRRLKDKGVYAPLTKHGTIVVNNMFTSCYAHINHHGIAHAALAPVRWMHSIMSWFDNSKHLSNKTNSTSKLVKDNMKGEVHWYAEILHSLAPYVIPHNLLYNS